MLIAVYVWISTVLLGCIGYAITSNHWAGYILKMVLYAMTICGVVILVKENGFSGIPLK